LDDRLKHLMKELGDAINESLSESEPIGEVIAKIKQHGYDVFLVLEATIGFSKRDEEEATPEPVVTNARKSIANFKVRAGFPVGCMVTLRGARMYEFLDRLVNIAIPRIRDFRGVSSRAFDGRGNYSLGIKEQIIFPEIEYDKIDALRGMNVAIITTAKTDDEARALLAAFRFPFKH